MIPVVEQALIDFSAGRIQQPVRSVLPVSQHNGLWALMPAIFDDVMGAKLVTLYTENAIVAFRLIRQAFIFSARRLANRWPLMDGRLITELRTAAVSAVATRLLAKPDARVFAILGSGVQAQSHVAALRLVTKFEEIMVWSRTPQHARPLRGIDWRTLHQPRRGNSRGGCGGCRFYTREPLVAGEWLKPDAM